jgi:glyoxylate reductase
MKKVFIARKIDDKGIEMLKKHFEVVENSVDKVLSKEELIKQSRGCDAIVTLLSDEIDADVIEKIDDSVSIIANYAVGFDNIDICAAAKKNIIITNTPEVMTQAVAEHAMTLLLACARRVVEGDNYVRSGKYKIWEPDLLPGPEIAGKTLGIIGVGRIGAVLASIAYHGFGMKVLYHDIQHDEEVERNFQANFVSMNQLLEKSDFISLHVPLCPSTKHMISTGEFKMMKKSAILVNTSRGAVINEKAMIKALRDGEIFAAGLDVFESEGSIDPDLIALKNVVLTPHIASATHEARESMSVCVAENIIEVLSGRPAKTPVEK